jgi:hypothetical protein
MGLRWELVEEYSAELHALEKSPASRRDEAGRRRREWLLRVVDDLQHGVKSPLLLLAIRERGQNRGRQA